MDPLGIILSTFSIPDQFSVAVLETVDQCEHKARWKMEGGVSFLGQISSQV